MPLVEALCALLVEVGLLLSWGAVVVVLEAEARGTAPAADWLSAEDGSASSAGLIAAAAAGGGTAESCSEPASAAVACAGSGSWATSAAVAWLSSSCVSAAGLCGSITDGLIASRIPPWCTLLPLY